MADPEDGRMNGGHLDEGVAHAWLDGQLSAEEAARAEAHIAACAACAAVVAEARGFVAASSRILTQLDGVRGQVVPGSRARTRVWHVRAAAAVLVVVLGAAAVLSDTGGRLGGLRRDGVVARQQPPSALAKMADSQPAAPAAVPAPSAAPPRAITPPRAAAPSPRQRELQQEPPAEPQQQPQMATRGQQEDHAMQHEMAQQKQLQSQQRDDKKALALNEGPAAQTGMLTDQAVARVRRDTPGPIAPPMMRSALAAKAAPASVGSAEARTAADSLASTNMMKTFSLRRLASNAAYRRCAGQVVTIPEATAANIDAPARLTTVRLDSAAGPPGRGFVVAAISGQSATGGWWIPAGADSAVVSLPNQESAGRPAGAADAVTDSGTPGAGGAIAAAVTRVRCPSP